MSAATVTTCPAWCQSDHGDDPTWMTPVHYRRVGELGVECWADEDEDGQLGEVHVIAGDVVDTDDLTPAQAFRLAVDLIDAYTALLSVPGGTVMPLAD